MGKYGLKKTPYLDFFQALSVSYTFWNQKDSGIAQVGENMKIKLRVVKSSLKCCKCIASRGNWIQDTAVGNRCHNPYTRSTTKT